ncbi:hypothetical protein OAO87_00350 [bacterium]|nr:hypothetical protein [bacterium]
MSTLQKKATDALVDQLMDQIGNARIVAPHARFNALDGQYIGRLRDLLSQAFPGSPPELFHTIREDLIVISRDFSPPSTQLVRFDDSRLRVPKMTAERQEELERYSALTSAEVLRTRYLDTDLADCALTFDEQWFASRSLEKWEKLAHTFARMTSAWVELKRESGLKNGFINEVAGTHLIPCRIVGNREGEEVELELEAP